jgi:AI-2 transport protein TqsA
VAVSLLVAAIDALILWVIGLELWLVFGVVAFWLNFIPNVGMFTSVCLPMPLVLLDPHYSASTIAFAFFGPLAAGLAAKDVLEPLLIGRSTSLQPVAVLLAIMLWGSVWGVTGMVLAVPMTAVARIYLAGRLSGFPLRMWG